MHSLLKMFVVIMMAVMSASVVNVFASSKFVLLEVLMPHKVNVQNIKHQLHGVETLNIFKVIGAPRLLIVAKANRNNFAKLSNMTLEGVVRTVPVEDLMYQLDKANVESSDSLPDDELLFLDVVFEDQGNSTFHNEYVNQIRDFLKKHPNNSTYRVFYATINRPCEILFFLTENNIEIVDKTIMSAESIWPHLGLKGTIKSEYVSIV